jgi:hypothetical protein
MNEEQVVKVAAQMYGCRRTLKSLFGAEYEKHVDPYGKVIRRVAAARGIEIISAALAMAQEMKAVDSDPIITICLMAAAVDIVEPSPVRTEHEHRG